MELLFAFSVIAALAVVSRLVFGAGRRPSGKRDYGLLREVALAPSDRAAAVVTDLLREHDIKATTVPRTDADGVRIMVFGTDEARAVQTLLDAPWRHQEH